MAFSIAGMRFLFYRHIIPQKLVTILSVSNNITLPKESATVANVIRARSKE